MLAILGILSAVLGILGGLLTAFRRPLVGHVVWCIGNPLWITWAVMAKQPAVAAQAIVFFVLAVVGVWRWRGWRVEIRQWRNKG